MTSATTQLSYQFYFLFRRYRAMPGQRIEEPLELPDEIKSIPAAESIIGYPDTRDGDKRLFRLHVPNIQNPDTMPQHLAACWQTVRQQYQNCTVRDMQTGQISDQDASEDLLIAVMLLVVDDRLKPATHTVQLPMYNAATMAEQVGCCDYLPSQRVLTITPKAVNLNQVPTLFSYAPQLKPSQTTVPLGKSTGWQLTFNGSESPYLSPLQDEETANHPIFMVYGLARHELNHTQHPNWQQALDDRLLYGNHPDDNGKSILMFLLVPVLMKNWQYSHIEAVSRHLDDKLRQANVRYRDIEDASIRSKHYNVLQDELHQMKQLEAEASYEMGRIPQAIQTLQINARTLLRRMDIIERALDDKWQFDWRWQDAPLADLQRRHRQQPLSDQAKPLLSKGFDDWIEDLTNRQHYIQGKLKHLQGSSQRWALALEEQRFKLHDKLKHIGNAIIFLVALAQLGPVLQQITKNHEKPVLQQMTENHEKNAEDYGWFQPVIESLCWFIDLLHWIDGTPVMHFFASILQSPSGLILLVILIIIFVAPTLFFGNWQRRAHNASIKPSTRK